MAPAVAPCNVMAWEIWRRCVTQWQMVAGAVIGIDLAAVRIVAELLGSWDLETLDKVQVMEAEQLEIWREVQESVHRGKVRRGRVTQH